MKIAIIHDWLVTYAGAERVLEQILNVYPEADLFSTVDFIPEGKRDFIKNKQVTTSFIQNLPFAKNKYRSYLPLMPIAVEQFDLSSYDLVISSSHAVAKGVLTGPDQTHICMCYSPIRYAWDLQHQYLNESNLNKGIKGLLARWILHKIRLWDVRTAHGVDSFIAISKFIEKRIEKVYRRKSTVIYPPVYTSDFKSDSINKEEFYFTSSRMVPYKRIDLIARTFSERFPNKKLIIIGDGPEFDKIKQLAKENVTLLGYQDFGVLRQHLQKAKAFIFASEEDFGIAPLEAQAAGTPVIAFGKGGALETIRGLEQEEPSGVFFYEQSVDALSNAITLFENNTSIITKDNCVKNAEKFNETRFKQELESFVNKEM